MNHPNTVAGGTAGAVGIIIVGILAAVGIILAPAIAAAIPVVLTAAALFIGRNGLVGLAKIVAFGSEEDDAEDV